MQRIAHALLGAALVGVAAAPAAAQVSNFDGMTPFAGWVNPAYGAAATLETNVGSVGPLSAPYFALLRGNDATATNLLALYPNTPPGLPSPVTTGSVATYTFNTAPGTLSLSLNFLGNPFNLGDFSLGTDRNRDVALVRLLHNSDATTLFYGQIQQDGSLGVTGAAFANGTFGGTSTGAASFDQTYGWMNGSYALTDAGSYTLEFTVANQFDKDDDVALGIDDINVAAVPEPATVTLMLTGLAATGVAVRRRRRSA